MTKRKVIINFWRLHSYNICQPCNCQMTQHQISGSLYTT